MAMTASQDNLTEKHLLPYWLLAGLALAHLLYLMSYVPSLLPYVSDDVWIAWAGLHSPLKQLFVDCWTSAKDMGRIALYLQYVILALAFRYPAEAYLWQSFPLLLAIVLSAVFIGRYTQSLRQGLSLFILIGLGSFITGPHHLFSSYPAAFALGFACSLAYIMAGLSSLKGWAFAWLRVILFVFPLFIYEAFFPIQIAGAAIIAIRTRKWKKVIPEAVVMSIIVIAYSIVSHNVHGHVYQGTTLAHSFAATPYTFLKYATGFFILPTIAKAGVMILIICWAAYMLWKRQLPHAALAGYFLVLWLVPPMMLAITPKYQIWAQKTGPLGSPIYLISFMSEIGCFGLLTLLLATCEQTLRLTAVACVGLFMWISWHDITIAFIEDRQARFAALDAAIAKKKLNGEINCFTIRETRQLLRPWEYCEYEQSCKDVTPDVLLQRGSQICPYAH